MRDFSFLLPLLLQLYKLQSVCFPGVETPTITTSSKHLQIRYTQSYTRHLKYLQESFRGEERRCGGVTIPFTVLTILWTHGRDFWPRRCVKQQLPYFISTSLTIFRKMMKVAFPVAESSKTVTPSPISNSELNALRYAAGYVCRTVRKRIKRMKLVNVQLKLSLEELLEDDSAGSNADVCGSSKSSGKNNRECDDDVGGDAVDSCDGDGDSSNDDESDGGTSDAGRGEGDSDGNCDGDDHGDGGNGAICSEADCGTRISSTRQ